MERLSWPKGPVDAWTAARAALCSRAAICLLLALSDVLLPDWEDGDASVAQFAGVPLGLRAFTRWDAARFLNIARDGYTDEQAHAFFPGLPMLVRFLAPAWLGASGLVLTGVAISNACFVLSAVVFHQLTEQLLDRRLASRATLVYCATPASVFHSTVYSESPFALCTLGGLLLLQHGHRAGAALAFAAGTGFRANGIVNAGFLLYDALARCVRQRRPALLALVAGVLGTAVVFLPYAMFEAYGYGRFCSDSGRPAPAWCRRTVPSLYSHVQREYWGNGLFAYWELKQIPNFLFAAPALSVAFGGTAEYARASWAAGPRSWPALRGLHGPALLPHVVQTTVLALGALLAMHVEVSTRFLSAASPSFHWWLANASLQPRRGTRVAVYLLLFATLGVIMHPNGLPWT